MTDYSNIIGVCDIGCLVDSSLFNIDGTAINDQGVTLIGRAVTVKKVYHGYKIINHDFTDNSNQYGIVLRDYSEYCKEHYDSGGAINVVTSGRVWVDMADQSRLPENGDPVCIDGGGVITTDGIKTTWIFTGEFSRLTHNRVLAAIQL